VQAWCDFIDAHPNAMLYCFRGGQRSQIAQQWIAETGRGIVRLRGGYKAFRRYLIDETERACGRFEPLILGGRTGSGKTIVLQKLKNAIDLEALANHRGSSFGRHITPQPPQIAFENALAYALIETLEAGHRQLVFEDEGKNIGRDYLPETLHQHLLPAPLVILETVLEERIAITKEEYVIQAQARYPQEGEGAAFLAWKEDILQAMERIRKRLGGLRHQKLVEMFEAACTQQLANGDYEAHDGWIAYLLTEYYDPMYDYQIERRSDQVVFRGDADAVVDWLETQRQNTR
jgi:tRNA 2-selenouridine synthase